MGPDQVGLLRAKAEGWKRLLGPSEPDLLCLGLFFQQVFPKTPVFDHESQRFDLSLLSRVPGRLCQRGAFKNRFISFSH